MAYRVAVTEVAAAEIDSAYEWIEERAPDAAERWYDGLMAAVGSLRHHPRRYARVPMAESDGPEIRQLIYGRRRGQYRVLFVVHEDTVEVLNVRHSARAPIRR